MVRAGVVPVGEGVMRLSSTNDPSREYVLDVLEDGRIRWCDELSSCGEVFQSPLACCAKIWNIAAPKRYYERILVSCADTAEERTLKELKDEFVASKRPREDVSCQDTSGVSEHDTGSCGIQEYYAVIPTWSERGPRSSGLMAECVGDVGMVHARKCRKRPSCADSGDATHTPQQRDVHRERGEEEEEEEEYDDGVFEYGLEEEVTVCQPVGGIEHDKMRHDGVKVGSGMLDMGLNASEVIERIECCVEFILSTLSMGQLPVFFSSPADVSQRQKVLFGIDPGNVSSLDRFALFVSMLNTAHERLLCTGHRSTQRELYYASKARDPLLKATQHADVLRNACRVLQVPRYSLGIDCCSKGLVYGPLVMEFTGSLMPSVDCSLLERGYSIPGCIPLIWKSTMRCRASCILVIEKETMFQRFVQASPMLKDCLLVTAKGYPDIATRAFLKKLHDTYPSIPMVGLVDWNPHGLHILAQYKFGSENSPESKEFTLPYLQWLGLRMSTIKGLSVEGGLQEMTKRDYSLSKNLLGVLKAFGAEQWAQELECMSVAGVKADFESLYEMLTMESICQIFSTMILREEWI
ncbi:hypothetical protein M9435_005374 [Picochlorum sp. BPE23]|nr:hypothetical protein M9435_005374 [Picochlorum sp. BPE23]